MLSEERGILSPVRLPVPPLQQVFDSLEFTAELRLLHVPSSLTFSVRNPSALSVRRNLDVSKHSVRLILHRTARSRWRGLRAKSVGAIVAPAGLGSFRGGAFTVISLRPTTFRSLSTHSMMIVGSPTTGSERISRCSKRRVRLLPTIDASPRQAARYLSFRAVLP